MKTYFVSLKERVGTRGRDSLTKLVVCAWDEEEAERLAIVAARVNPKQTRVVEIREIGEIELGMALVIARG